MCADNTPAMRASRPGPRHRSNVGRQRPLLGVTWLFAGRPESRGAFPSARSTDYVGRVGALAVALGVGAAVAGVGGVAAADTGDDSGAGRGAARSGDSESSSRAPRSGERRTGSAARSVDSPSPAQAVEVPTAAAPAGDSSRRSANPGRRASTGLRSGAAVTVPQGTDAGLSARLGGQTSVNTSSPLGALLTPGGLTGLLQQSVASLIGDLLFAAPGSGAVPDAAPAPELTAPPQTTAPAVDGAPSMTAAAPAAALSESEVGLLDALGGNNGGLPAAATLAWAAAAVARRDELTGASPEVAPAAAEDTGAPVDPSADATATDGSEDLTATTASITSFSPGSGVVGDTVTITGVDFPVKGTSKGQLKQIDIGSGSTTDFTRVSDTEITVTVPGGATTGKITLEIASGLVSPTKVSSSQNFTVVAPAITSFSPGSGVVGDTVTITGAGFPPAGTTKGLIKEIDFGNGKVNYPDFTRVSDTEITVAVPDGATTGKITLYIASGSSITPATKVSSTQDFTVTYDGQAYPEAPDCDNAVCKQLIEVNLGFLGTVQTRPLIVNQLSKTIETALPTSGPALTCVKAGCPYPPGETTTSVANTIGMYAFNVIDALAGNASDEVVGQQVVNLVTQPNVLTFISQTVASQLTLIGAPTAAVPEDVANTIGNTVAVFVEKSFGNLEVATAFAPFLKTLGVPTTDGQVFDLATKYLIVGKSINDYILDKWNTQAGATALTSLFSDPTVQQDLEAAVTDSIEVLLGQASPTWDGAPQVPSTAVSSYLGQTAAELVLGPDNIGTAALAATIGTAAQNLFGSIGDIVATEAGAALGTLVNAPGQNIPTTLADFTVNALFGFLQGADGTKPLPYPDLPPLGEALAGPSGLAVAGLVNALFNQDNAAAVKAGLSSFIAEVIPGALSNPGVEALIGEEIAKTVTTLLPGPLGTVVSAQVAAAVTGLLSQPVISGALTTLVNGVLIGVLDAPGVVPALATAAGTLTSAALTGTLDQALKDVTAALRANASIQEGVQTAVTTSVAQLLNNTGVWTAVDATLVELLSGLLGNQDVQDAVLTFFEDGPLGPLGTPIGEAVVALMRSPDIGQLLTEVVDTVTFDFFTTDGVVETLSNAAGILAKAAVAGNLDEVLPEVQQQLRVDPAIDAGIQRAVGDAVTELISNPALADALDAAVVALATSLIEDPQVQQEISTQVANQVSTLLGGGDLGDLVGAQVGTAVLDLITDPVVNGALIAVVDTLIGDFLRSPGVAAAFGDAAGELAVSALVTGNLVLALQAAEDELRANTDIQQAVQTSVAAAVTELLDDAAVWQAVDGQVVTLIDEILADQPVQDAVYDAVAAQVSALLGGGGVGMLVGAQVGEAVVDLMTNPALSGALIELFDTVTYDFFTTEGVVPALSNAAGELAAAAVAGTYPEVSQRVQEELRTNPAIDTGVQRAVGDAVTEFLTDTDLWQAVDGEVATLIEEILADPPVQAAVAAQVADLVSTALGGGDLGETVGAQFGAAAVALMQDQVVAEALIELFDTLVGDFFRAQGVVPAFATVAEGLALGALTTPPWEGFNWELALAGAEAQLRADTAIQNGAKITVTAAVYELLDDIDLWQAVDGQFVTLVDEILKDAPVQAAVSATVAAQVAAALGGGEIGGIGATVGAQVGDAVVALMKSDAVSDAVIELVNTVLSDFFGTAGVVAALSNAAGDLAAAAVAGTYAEVSPVIQEALRTSPPVETGVQRAVGDAVTEFLTDTDLWQAVDGQVATLIEEILKDAPVQAAVYDSVYATVFDQLGGTAVAQELAGQIGDAAVALMNDQVVSQALIDVVNTLVGDFFTTPGVVPSFSIVAQQLALEALTTPPWEGFNWVLALASAEAELRSSPYILEGVDLAIYETVAELLNDTNLWGAVDAQVATLIGEALADQPLEDAVGEAVAAQVAALLGGGDLGGLGAAVGAQVGDAVENLMRDPVVGDTLVELVNTVFGDFFGTNGVVEALSSAAGDLAMAAVAGNLDEVGPAIQEKLRTNPAVDTGVQRAVGDAVTELLTDATLWQAVDGEFSSLVTNVLADTAIQDAAYGVVAAQVSVLVGGGDLGQVVGAQVGDAVVSLMRDPEVGQALIGAVNTLFGDFFGAPGVVPTFAIVADELALSALTTPPGEGFNWVLALAAAEAALRSSPNIQVGADLAVYDAATKLLDDTQLWQDVGTTLGTLTTNLIESTVVQQAVGAQVATTVSDALGGGAFGAVVGQDVGDAVQQFLAVPDVATGLGAVIGAALPDLFSKPGVDTALAEAAGQIAAAEIAGALPAVLPEIEQRLLTAVRPALEATIADTLNLLDTDVLSDPAVQQAAGEVVTTLVEQLAGDPAVRSEIQQQLGSAVGPAVAELLADTTVVDNIATALGAAVTEVLGYPGFTTTLTDTINQFADQVLDGTETSQALQNALATLESSPDYRAALGVAVPQVVGEVLGNVDDRTAFGEAARQIVVAELGIRNRFLQNLVGQVTEGTVVAFLADQDSWPLISQLGIDALTGTPAGQLPRVAIDLVLDDPQMPRVIGFAIGQGIGSLFGQNIIGAAIGGVVGIGATVVLGLTFGVINIFRALTGRDSNVPGAAAATVVSTADGDDFVGRVPAPGDLYAMKAIVEDWSDVELLHQGATGDGGLVLTKLDVTEVDQADQVDQFLDITMLLTDGSRESAQEQAPGPRLVARFRFDGIVPLQA